MSAIILDTETTDAEKDAQPIEIARTNPMESPFDADYIIERALYKPTKAISLGALATHHIIADDLKDCGEWPGKMLLDQDVKYLVGHNVDFDWRVIGSPNVKRICTLALARYVFPSIDSHKLSACIYHIYPHGMARTFTKDAHSAASDVTNCARLLRSICGGLNLHDWEAVWALSEIARVPVRFSFGKYGPADGNLGKPIAEVRRMDPGYIKWCLSGKCDLVNDDPYLRKALLA